MVTSGCQWLSSPRQAILIVLDAARPDRFSAYGYSRETTPEMDRLAKSGVVFQNTYAQATFTRDALPRLLYSRYFSVPMFPFSGAVPFSIPRDLFRQADTQAMSLPRVLGASGFRTAAISAHPWIKVETDFAQQFDETYDLSVLNEFDHSRGFIEGEQVIGEALKWIAEHKDENYFLYLHLMDTHTPHFFDADAQSFFDQPDFEPNRFDGQGSVKDTSVPLTGLDREYLDALYDGSVRYVDRQLGKLFARLKEIGRLDSSLIVITADHGEALLEVPGRWGHMGPWYEEEARVPLIVHYPRKVSPGVRLDFAEAVDLMPTMLDLLGVAPPAPVTMDGMALMRTRTRKEFVASSSGIRDRRYKLLFLANEDQIFSDIVNRPADALGEGSIRLFDLETDPSERVDVAAENDETVHRLMSLYKEKLGPLFERFANSTRSEPLRSSFAIAAAEFEVVPKPTMVPGSSSLAEAASTRTPTGWLQYLHWDLSYLLARKAAQPVEVRFPLPSGTYDVKVFVSGSVDILLAGATQPKQISSDAPTTALDPWSAPGVDVGEMTVADDEFRATLTPVRGGGPVLIRMFGFSPRNGNETSGEDEGRLKQLRSLGYVK